MPMPAAVAVVVAVAMYPEKYGRPIIHRGWRHVDRRWVIVARVDRDGHATA